MENRFDSRITQLMESLLVEKKRKMPEAFKKFIKGKKGEKDEGGEKGEKKGEDGKKPPFWMKFKKGKGKKD